MVTLTYSNQTIVKGENPLFRQLVLMKLKTIFNCSNT